MSELPMLPPERPMHLSVAAHDPEVLLVTESQRDEAMSTLIVELGKKSGGRLGPATVTLFMQSHEALSFVTDLVNGIEDVKPGFLLALLDELTG